jgi:glycosyltransferase involved in cell wall biosynthesis
MIDKNILYFTRTMGLGGTEKVILQLCRNFNSEFNKIVVCSIGGLHEEELKKLGIKHYKINDIENKNPINILKTFLTLKKIIKNEKIDIIHTHHRMAAFYTSILKKIMNFKFIHTVHNTFLDKKVLTKISLSTANIIAVGKKVKENLYDFYKLNSEKIEVIYNGIEKDTNEIVEVPEIKKYKEQGYFIVGNVGRLSEQKGMEFYIKAIPNILKNNDKVMFFIVGDGEDKNKLEKLVNDLNIKDNIIFLGYRNDVTNVIKQLDVVVLSSLWEGLPLTPIEAFSVGKTVIGTNVDGTPEIIRNEYNGILIESKEPIQIAEAILKLFNSKDTIKKYEQNAFKTFDNKFNLKKFNENYEQFYLKIASEI